MTEDPAVREWQKPWPREVDAARWLLGATSSGEPHRRAVVAVWDEIQKLRAVVSIATAYVNAPSGELRDTDGSPMAPSPDEDPAFLFQQLEEAVRGFIEGRAA